MVRIDRVTEEDEEIRPLFENRVENRIALRPSAALGLSAQIAAPGEGDSSGDRRIGQRGELALSSDMPLGRTLLTHHHNVIAVPSPWIEAVDEDGQGKICVDAGHQHRRSGSG